MYKLISLGELMLRLLWLVPLLPLLGFAVNGLFGARWLPRRVVGLLACAAVLGSFVLSAGAVLELQRIAPWPDDLHAGAAPRFTQDLFEWMPMGRSAEGAVATLAGLPS